MSENRKVLNDEELVKVSGGKMNYTGGGEGNAAKVAASKTYASKNSAMKANASKNWASKFFSAFQLFFSKNNA